MRHNDLGRWVVGTSGGEWEISRRGAERERAQRGLAVDLAVCAPHGNVNEGNLDGCFRYRESRSLGENLKDTILKNSKTPSSESNNRRLSEKGSRGAEANPATEL